THEWHLSRYHFVKHHAETPDVSGFFNRRAERLLRRHVTYSPKYEPEIGLNQQQRFVSWHGCWQLLFGKFCNSEVEHFHVSVRSKHDVLRLDVAMNNSRLVSSRERACHLDGDINSFTQLHRSTSQAITQCLAFDQFAGDVMN